MRPNRLRNGIILIGLGIALLLYNMDRLDGQYFMDLLHLWPILLIAIGIEIISRNSTAAALGYLSPVLVLGAFVYAGYADRAGWDGWSVSFGDGLSSRNTVERTFTTENPVTDARVYVDIFEGDLKIRGGSTTDLGRGEFTSAGRVLTSISEENGRAVVRVRQSGSARRRSADFDLSLIESTPFTLDLKGRDVSVLVDGAPLHVKQLYLELEDGEADITLGRGEDSVWASLAPGDARLNLRLPKDAGLRVEGISSSDDYDWGPFVLQSGMDASETQSFSAAPVRVVLKVVEPISKLRVEGY